jgi:hypothetical protein
VIARDPTLARAKAAEAFIAPVPSLLKQTLVEELQHI